MAKRSKQRKTPSANALTMVTPLTFRIVLAKAWIPLLLALITFLVYLPSLFCGFVYDAQIEILQEGFITQVSNLPAVLSLQVLGMPLNLASRPGQMLYMMIIAIFSGQEPFGYHLGSNLLHAANVALFFILLQRLLAVEISDLSLKLSWKVHLATVIATLLFALHPIAVEPVSEISYSSTLLQLGFILVALLAATFFRPENLRLARWVGGIGVLSCLAAVICKESGLAAVLLLLSYWFVYRRGETRLPWFYFLGAATTVTVLFLTARLLLAAPSPDHLEYLGGSFFKVFWLQPQLWIYMVGQLLWPVNLSADYALIDLSCPSPLVSILMVAGVMGLQGWLAYKSHLGALGMAFYWLGLLPVSNFIPMYRILADRFYYLPLAGVAMELLALLLLTIKSRRGFWVALVPLFLALLPLAILTVDRQDVFKDEYTLWSDTVRANPLSSIGHFKLADILAASGRLDEADFHYRRGLEISPNVAEARNNYGSLLARLGHTDAALELFQQAVQIRPSFALAHYNLGVSLEQKGRVDEAMAQYLEALHLKPEFAAARNALAKAQAMLNQRPVPGKP